MSFEENMDIINQKLNALVGLHFAESQWKNLENNVKLSFKALNLNYSPEGFVSWISQTKIPSKELEILANHLTIGETYFFREKIALNLLQDKIIPAIKDAQKENGDNKSLKIWSAGCSSGEEPYSIAILLKEILPDLGDWDIQILATDINTVALEKAREGKYTAWSFRDTPENIKKKYFIENGKTFELKPEIRKMVNFSRLNLASDVFPSETSGFSDLDVIFCRNVLMYFSPEVIKNISEKFYQTLKKEAWFITSQVELNDQYFGNFQRIVFEGGIFYRKSSRELQQDFYKNNFSVSETNGKPNKAKKNIPQVKPLLQKKKAIKEPSSVDKRLEISAEFNEKNEISEAEALFAMGSYQDCIILCKRLLTKQSSNTEITFLLSKAYANAGKLDEAMKTIKLLVANQSDNAEYYYFLATILMEQKLWDEADKNLVKALYLDPGLLAARLSRSRVLKHLNKNEQSKKEIENLLNDIDGFDDYATLPGLDDMTAGRLRQMARLYS
jgi:chemotaxis protein methyltransferase CheR